MTAATVEGRRRSVAASARAQLALILTVEVMAMGLWFSASAVTPTLVDNWHLSINGVVWLTAAVQVGFVAGAIGSAALNLSDRFAPERVLAASSLAGAMATIVFATVAHGFWAAIPLRLLTGVALAGVYPTGMSILASWFSNGRALAFGLMIAALAVGSGSPHLLAGIHALPATAVLLAAAGIAVGGAAIALLFVREGPLGAVAPPFEPRYALRMVRDRSQRLITLAYAGHMWELYALWTWIPAFLSAWFVDRSSALSPWLVGLATFGMVAVAGAAGSVVAGVSAERAGSAGVAKVALATSALCCLLSTVLFGGSVWWLIVLITVWGASALADSAQFSFILSEAADRRYIGTALTLQTAFGFAVTVVTIQVLPYVADVVGWRLTPLVLAVGPALGLWAMIRMSRTAAP